MELTYPPEAATYRAKVRSFLTASHTEDRKGIGALNHGDAFAFTQRWRATLHENGYLAVNWPKDSPYPSNILTPNYAQITVPWSPPSAASKLYTNNQQQTPTLLIYSQT